MGTVTLLSEPSNEMKQELSCCPSDPPTRNGSPRIVTRPNLHVSVALQQVGPAVAEGREIERLVVHAHTPVDLISTWSSPSPSGSGTIAPVLCEMCIAVMISSAFRPSRPVPTLSRSSMKHRTLSSAAP